MKSNKYLWFIIVIFFFSLFPIVFLYVCCMFYHIPCAVNKRPINWSLETHHFQFRQTQMLIHKKQSLPMKILKLLRCWMTYKCSLRANLYHQSNQQMKNFDFFIFKINYCYASLHLFDHNLPALWQTMTIYLLLVFRCIF